MLYEIESPATEANAAILLNQADTVAIARVPLSPSQTVRIGEDVVEIQSHVPAGHKFARRQVRRGEPVMRYGNVIGTASADIGPGEHIHTHNLTFEERPSVVFEGAKRSKTLPKPGAEAFFEGYLRADGRAGTRNYIAVVAASNCAAHTSEMIAGSFEHERLPAGVDGIVAFPHGEGCGHTIGPDTEQLQRTLEGVLHHPNVSAAVILGLGCEVNQVSHYLGGTASQQVGKSLHGLTLQESGGTLGAVEQARQRIGEYIERAAAEKRARVPLSKLSVGLNCGGSDSFSGITANPALGFCCDLIVQQGGTVVLGETTEMFGAEHILAAKARDERVAEELLECVQRYKNYLRQFGGSFNDNPSPGNKEGGLTNIVEKSLGAIAKAGSSPLESVVRYAERVESHGFVFMDTPGYDPVSLTGLAAGGVNLIAFTTGRGSAIGFPSIPVLKIASNSAMYRRMSANMDINAGRIADGGASVEEVGREIFDALLRAASGERTKAEQLGHHEFSPWRIGPVL